MSTVNDIRKVLGHVWRHPANSGRRVRGVTRAVNFQIRGRLGLRTRARIGRHGRMWVDLHQAAASAVLYGNPPDWNEMWAWRRLLRPGDLFVDVGANVGGYALWAADSGATVVAVEPDPDAAARLRENIALNPFAIEVRECALAAEPGRMRLSTGHGAMNHLILGDGPTTGTTTVDVAVTTLDELLGDRSAAGVKIDVEGAERIVLAGAHRALSQRRIGVLQLEWNTASIGLLGESRLPLAELLSGYGYTMMRPGRDGVLRPAAVRLTTTRDMFAVAPTHPLLSFG